MKIFILSALLLFSCVSDKDTTKHFNPPDWFLKRPTSNDIDYFAATGKSRIEAIVAVLNNLNSNLETEFREDNFVSSRIFLSSISKSRFYLSNYLSDMGTNASLSTLIQSLTYQNESGGRAFIEIHMSADSSNSYMELKSTFENTNEEEIIKDLQNLGFTFQYEVDNGGNYYVLAEISKQKLLDALENDYKDEMDDIERIKKLEELLKELKDK